MKILVTGSAGFIGSALTLRLLARGDTIVGIDNHNDYYDPALKEARIEKFIDHPNYTHLRVDLSDRQMIKEIFTNHKPERVVNLAAQAGVRYSIKNPLAYINSNIVGFAHILEGCRHNEVEHLVYASTSSVYGANTSMPFSTHQNVNHPLSVYSASKKSNELMAFIMNAEWSYTQRQRMGELHNLFAIEMDKFVNTIRTSIQVLTELSLFLFYLSLSCWISIKLTGIMILFLAIALFPIKILNAYIHLFSERTIKSRESLYNVLQQL